ncbi:hypothetical protein LCGC14_2220540 [marine sediment metagenome]|uniref:Uncharacterized protein n=1 Tax=marine sediment metagenome TaxID=412755 RepID=A0A0F9DB86_9ZZZZ
MVGTRYVSLGSERVSTTSVVTPGSIDPNSATGLALSNTKIIRATVRVEEGPLRWNSVPGKTATQDGNDGSTIEYRRAEFILWGTTEIANFRYIPVEGVKRVTLMIRYEGTQ